MLIRRSKAVQDFDTQSWKQSVSVDFEIYINRSNPETLKQFSKE